MINFTLTFTFIKEQQFIVFYGHPVLKHILASYYRFKLYLKR